MVKTVLKLLPDGDYIQLPEDYSGLDLLAEVCTLEPEKLERLVNKQVTGHVQHCPDCHILEPPRASSSEDKGDVCGGAAAMKMSRDYSISLPYSVLNSNKRTRPWDTGDDNATNQKETSAAAKKKKKQKIKKTNHHQGPDPPPAMPIDFRNKILQLAGPNAMISDEKRRRGESAFFSQWHESGITGRCYDYRAIVRNKSSELTHVGDEKGKWQQ